MLIFVATRSAHRQKWQRHLHKLEQKRNPNFQPASCAVVGVAEESTGISELLIYAGYVFGNWLARENCRG